MPATLAPPTAPKADAPPKPAPARAPEPGGPITVPASARTLEGFRAWIRSGEVPEQAEVAFWDGEIWIDMTNERIRSHVGPKTSLAAALVRWFDDRDFGKAFGDGVTLVNEAADLACGPDAVAFRWESFDSGRVALGEPTADSKDDSVELVGSPDLVAEVLSASSVRKDTRVLPAKYFEAGVDEFWQVDARGPRPTLRVLVRGEEAFEPAAESDGWQRSGVLGREVRLTTLEQRHGFVRHRFEDRA